MPDLVTTLASAPAPRELLRSKHKISLRRSSAKKVKRLEPSSEKASIIGLATPVR